MSGRAVRLGCGSLSAIFHRQSAVIDRVSHVLGSPLTVQSATLTATHGEKYPYLEPFPYWKKRYNLYANFFDKTIPRLNENSKVIVVEGNVGVGKKEFAQSLAKEFDLKYFGPTTDDLIFIDNDYGYDVRKLNVMLPEKAQWYDVKMFLSDPHPEKGYAAKLIFHWYQRKFYAYADVLKHVINTGQGAVMVRSAYSDIVFVDALRRMGWVSPQFVTYFNMMRDFTICDLLKPHMTIYLDAPISVIRERINQRKDPREVGSKILSDKYLQAIADVYTEKFLPTMRKSGEVVELDWTEKPTEMDIDVIAEELQTYKLEPADNEDLRFQDWSKLVEDDWRKLRQFLDKRGEQTKCFSLPLPWDCDELTFNSEESHAFDTIVQNHPMFAYKKGWAPELGHSTAFKLY